MKIICIDGNIGSGKTTLIERIAKMAQVAVIDESMNDKNILELLEKYYKEPKKYAYDFQMELIKKKFDQFVKYYDKSPAILIFDRSFTFDAIFCRLHYELGNIDIADYSHYCKIIVEIEDLLKEFNIKKYYIKLDAAECIKRIAIRNRANEKETITLEYLQKIENYSQLDESTIIINKNIADEELLKIVS